MVGGEAMSGENGDTWFLAQLKPNSAQLANKNLMRQGYRTFLPLETTTRQRSGKFVTALRPIFPGYIFVAFDVAEGAWRSVNSTYGVTRLVIFGKKPASVPSDLVAQLFQRCDVSGKLLPPQLLKPGDQVRMMTGPFTNFVASIEAIAPDCRIWVLMDFMGEKTRVAVDADQLHEL